jgi:hypothetical protein
LEDVAAKVRAGIKGAGITISGDWGYFAGEFRIVPYGLGGKQQPTEYMSWSK